jgi:hypothetical protein
MSLSELINETCPICSNNLFLGNPGKPVDIISCHHKFHNNCLHRWCNNNQRNTLARCSCPSCRRAFNFNNELNDLNETIKRDLLKALVNGDYNNLSPEDKNTLQEIINQNNSEAPVAPSQAPVAQNGNFLAMSPLDFATMLLNNSTAMDQDIEEVNHEREAIQQNSERWLRDTYSHGIDENLLNEESKQQLILYIWNKKINESPRGRYGDNNTPQEVLNMTPNQFANHILQMYVRNNQVRNLQEFLQEQREEINEDGPLVWLETAYHSDIDDGGVSMNNQRKKMYENYIINQINQINQPRGGKSKKRVTKKRRVKRRHSRRN